MNGNDRHPLAAVLDAAAEGRFPPADGLVEVLAPDPSGVLAVVAFTGHAYVLAPVSPGEVAARQTDDAGGGLGGVLAPGVLSWLAGTDGKVGSIDVVLVTTGPRRRSATVASPTVPDDRWRGHPRVRRAEQHRHDLRVLGNDDGVVIVGRGLAGRWELSVELFDTARPPSGAGRALIADGLGLVPDGEPCWAQVAAGNARSLRAFLGRGFRPTCAEVLITPS